jgi:hypothetical protein
MRYNASTEECLIYSTVGKPKMLFDGRVSMELSREIQDAIRMAERNAYRQGMLDAHKAITDAIPHPGGTQ